MKRGQVYRLPQSEEKVGQYRVVGPLGQGGQGHLYLAEWEGCFYVLKLYRSNPADPCGELELDILRHLEHPNVVRVLGHGHWPYPEDGYLYIAMEQVEGQTLLRHTLEHNPSARWGATFMQEAARALAVVHRRRVLHRDIKPDNLMVREEDGKPVWVDFGVGHLEGRTTLPRLWRLPPGTPEYTSPEAYRFLQKNPDEEARYQPGVADEVWAFGVTLYELLTDELPFGSRMSNPHMVKDIRTRTPEAPHESNPRVPVELSRVCMHLLEKEPGARLVDMDAVAAALETALAGADASWDVPLMDPDAPQVRTTERTPSKVVDRNTWERVQQEMKAAMPRRGRVRKARRKPPPPPQAPAAVAAQLKQEEPVAPQPVAAPVLEVEGAALVVAARASVPAPPARSGPPARVLAVTLLVGALVLAGTWALRLRTDSGQARAPAPAPSVAPLPPGWLASSPTLHAYLVHEVAVSSGSSESGRGAVPFLAPPPAPTFATMLRKNDTRLKPEEKSTPRPQRQAPGCVPARQEMCLVGICTVLLTGCTATPQVVRPEPRPADCPPGALEAMKELDVPIKSDTTAGVTFPMDTRDASPVTVNESTPVQMGERLGKLIARLHGRIHIGAERIYGRFTEARMQGKTYPVCVELGQWKGTRWIPGVEREDVGGPADSAVVWSTQYVKAVDHFE
ncbi:serine/threonine protein kinase [Archangium lansingense]|uniref:non-specific serine/threonine protein kinase n=1 Tax=Archangium lansingense TaxID=2995310 RepID=A0ABT4AJQ4_9BACT|nr:serine/threonine-protein kinase [Archangium lansinium]MCY1081930.1 serine/threonine-protein kinase [Archangium lansinium]